jgi:phosphoribosylaminoimidazole-succinocarboxamide synthase
VTTRRPLLDGLTHVASGKVRDIYAVGDDLLLMVASDTVSAYDWILDTPIPDKGKILTRLSVWWFDQLSDVVTSHLVTADVDEFPASLRPHADALRDRSMLCRRLDMFPVECVARGYLAGSGLAEYREGGAVCGVPLPPGLVDASRLPEPIFTPATKAEIGEHDENVSYDQVAKIVGGEWAARLRETTLAVYSRAHEIAQGRGLILADTKFEFGRDLQGDLVLGDEVLTPDSSRYWMAGEWTPGVPQNPFDKQYIRDWLVGPESGWDRHSGDAPPPLPQAVVDATHAKYITAYEQLTQTPWPR